MYGIKSLIKNGIQLTGSSYYSPKATLTEGIHQPQDAGTSLNPGWNEFFLYDYFTVVKILHNHFLAVPESLRTWST